MERDLRTITTYFRHYPLYINSWDKMTVVQLLERKLSVITDYTFRRCNRNERTSIINVLSSIKRLGLNDEELIVICEEQYKLWYNSKCYNNKKVYTISRDNKEAINYGNRGCHTSKIRYPSLKRSKRTWANFYKLFPYLAEREHWDGEKSDRYNK